MAREKGVIAQFEVPGLCVPKGSWRAVVDKAGKPRLLPDGKRSQPWQQAIACAASESCAEVTDQALSVACLFVLPRPPSVLVSKRQYPQVKPDLDKLLRCVFDGLTATVTRDDGRVCQVLTGKIYDDGDRAPGVYVTVRDRAAVQFDVGAYL